MKLFQHQEEVLKQTENRNKVAYFLDMGLGKTFVGSEKMVKLGSRVNLIVCQKSKVQDWVDHFVYHYESEKDMMIYDCTLWKKSDWDEVGADPNFQNDPHERTVYVLVINYDLIWRRKDLLKLMDFTLMLDESSLIQNVKAKRTKFILKMNPSNLILLSGTPTSGKYENLWTQIHLLGWGISQDVYNKQYINWKKIDLGGFTQSIVDRDNPYKNVDRLKQKMRDHGAVFMKTEECFDLPDQTFIKQYVPSTKEYSKFMKNSIVTIDTVTLVGDTTLTKRMYARQLCGQYCERKLEAFKELVESTNDRLVVFYNFKEEVRKLINIANELERPWSIVSGDAKNLEAYESCDDSITFVQYQAGAMGLNLQKANKMIYFSLPERSDLFEQSKKRIHRIGQNNPCFYYILMCKGSVEEMIYQALKERKDFTDELFKV